MSEILIGGAVLLGAAALRSKLAASAGATPVAASGVTLATPAQVRLLTDAQIMALHAPRGGWDVIPENGGFGDRLRTAVLETLANGQIDIVKWAGVCAGKTQSSGAQLKGLKDASIALNMSTKFVSALTLLPSNALSAALPAALATTFATVALFGVGIAITILGYIFTHHAAQVALEQQYTCAGLPAANDAFTAIENGVQDGTITPARGSSTLDTFASDWNTKIIQPAKSHGVFQDSGTLSPCDALCFYNYLVLNLVEKNKNRYMAMATGGA